MEILLHEPLPIRSLVLPMTLQQANVAAWMFVPISYKLHLRIPLRTRARKIFSALSACCASHFSCAAFHAIGLKLVFHPGKASCARRLSLSEGVRAAYWARLNGLRRGRAARQNVSGHSRPDSKGRAPAKQAIHPGDQAHRDNIEARISGWRTTGWQIADPPRS